MPYRIAWIAAEVAKLAILAAAFTALLFVVTP